MFPKFRERAIDTKIAALNSDDRKLFNSRLSKLRKNQKFDNVNELTLKRHALNTATKPTTLNKSIETRIEYFMRTWLWWVVSAIIFAFLFKTNESRVSDIDSFQRYVKCGIFEIIILLAAWVPFTSFAHKIGVFLLYITCIALPMIQTHDAIALQHIKAEIKTNSDIENVESIQTLNASASTSATTTKNPLKLLALVNVTANAMELKDKAVQSQIDSTLYTKNTEKIEFAIRVALQVILAGISTLFLKPKSTLISPKNECEEVRQ